MRPHITYGRRGRNPPLLSTAQYQAVATSPHFHDGTKQQAATSNINRSTSLSITPFEPLVDNETNRGNAIDNSSPAYAKKHVLGVGYKRLSQKHPKLRRTRLFQPTSRRILTSSRASQQHGVNANSPPRMTAPCGSDGPCDTTGIHGLELVLGDTKRPSNDAHDETQSPVHYEQHDTMLSTIESCDSTPPSIGSERPLSELRRRLYACTFRDIPLPQLQAMKFRRGVKRSKVRDPLLHIGDGFETTERLTRLPVLSIKRRRAARPKPAYWRPLVLVTTSPHDNDGMSQRPAWQRRGISSQTSQATGDNGVDPVPPFDHQHHAEGISAPLDQVMQQLLQSISAPMRPETPATDEASFSHASQSSCSSSKSSQRTASSFDSNESWSGLVSSQSQLLCMVEPVSFFPEHPTSPSPSLLSSSDSFEPLEEEIFASQSSYHTAETDLAQQPSRRSYISTALYERNLHIQMPDSEGAVLETSQSPG